MFSSIVRSYRAAFAGLPRQVWVLALCLFVNRVGMRVFDKPRKAFAYDLQMSHARPIADAPLFDRTIERISANLRKLAGDS